MYDMGGGTFDVSLLEIEVGSASGRMRDLLAFVGDIK